jgi:hypothetical protein
MKIFCRIACLSVPALVLAGLSCAPAQAQVPAAAVPVILDTAVPIVVSVVKPKPTGLVKYQGTVMHANTAQITMHAIGNETKIQTFSLSQVAAVKMQTVVDKGGYQYGDKVTVFCDPTSGQVINFKGKPSKPI